MIPSHRVVSREPTSKRPKLHSDQPTRASARIANATKRPNHTEDEEKRVSSIELQKRREPPQLPPKSRPLFTPNKPPETIIRDGILGGSYWRPLYSRHLCTTVSEDWRELPDACANSLSVEHYLTSDTYAPEFQWYCCFWLGRRCEDDERQISRWRKCVGETGRWRRTLLKRYVRNNVRTVTDQDDEVGEKRDVSPVVHQTSHYWAWEVG
ncbi:hypothetical protein F4859DRAFT_506191 [Xylaria cf. heliscus]|nr:hypothetical protein F4859DRAFT_506191 [Xylaria cf. heliscus]